jgi:uncharacterized protein (TIGR03435 family)
MAPKYWSTIWAGVALMPDNHLWRSALLAVALALVSAPQIQAQSAQTAGAPLPSFEVASVKRSRSGENSGTDILPNRLTIRNITMEMIIGLAYGHDLGEFGFNPLRPNELVGGPSWVRGEAFGYDGYDIDAKVDDSLAEKFGKDCGPAFYYGRCGYRQQFTLMIQSLLADRFKLKLRRETRELPVYALVVAKGGPKFLQTKFEVPDYAALARNPTLPRPHAPPCPAGFLCRQDYMSMGQLADFFSHISQIGRPVIDQTGLQGGYYIKLQFVRPQSQGQMSAAPEKGSAGMDNAPPLGPSGPDIFTALQQQLGLKLKPTKGPVEFLVIDHIERPSEN